MPKQNLPDQMSFEAFRRSLLSRGFRQISRPEFASDFKRLGLVAPSPREGREAGFFFYAHGLKVIVWTTFLEAEGRARKNDSGWVLITQGDKAKYFARKLHRTGNFFYRLLLAACIARQRVLNRPQCPLCNAYANITMGKALKSRYWSCRSPAHQEYVSLPWDYGLPEEVAKVVNRQRQERRADVKRRRARGETTGTAFKKRIGWKVTKPENQAG